MKVSVDIFITCFDTEQLNFSYNQSINHSTSFHQAHVTCLASEIAKGRISKQEKLFSCLFFLCPCPLHDVMHLKKFQWLLGLYPLLLRNGYEKIFCNKTQNKSSNTTCWTELWMSECMSILQSRGFYSLVSDEHLLSTYINKALNELYIVPLLKVSRIVMINPCAQS